MNSRDIEKKLEALPQAEQDAMEAQLTSLSEEMDSALRLPSIAARLGLTVAALAALPAFDSVMAQVRAEIRAEFKAKLVKAVSDQLTEQEVEILLS